MWQRFPLHRPSPDSRSPDSTGPDGTAPVRMAKELWCDRVSEHCAACVDALADEGPARLRECLALLTLAPEASSVASDGLPTIASFEAMLACGAEVSAALALLPKGASYLLSRGEDDTCLASVILPLSRLDTGDEVTAEGASPALALTAALMASLVLPKRGQHNPVLADIDGLELPEAHWLN